MPNKIQFRRGNVADLPSLDAGEPGVATDTHDLYFGSGSGNIQVAKKSDLDATNASLADMTLNVLNPPNGLSPLKGDYNYSTNTGTDDSAALQAIINYAASSGAEILFPAGKMYYIGGNIQLAEGVKLKGVNWQGSKMDSALSLLGSVLIFKGTGATIYLHSHASVENFTIFYPEQKWFIQNDGTQPDGLEDFTSYPTTFVSNVENGGGFILNNLTVLGASDFYKNGTNGDLPMRFKISNIFGFVTNVGFDIPLMNDMSTIENVKFHATYCWGISDLRNVAGVAKNTETKILSSFTALRVGYIDGLVVSNFKVFGCHVFVDCYVNSSYPSNGAWLILNNCHVDVCKHALIVESDSGLIIWNGGTVTPIVNPSYDTDNSSLLKLTGNAEGNSILYNSVICFGQLNPTFLNGWCNSSPTPLRVEVAAQKANTIQLSNTKLKQYTGNLTNTNSINPITLSGVVLSDGRSYTNLLLGSSRYTPITLNSGLSGTLETYVSPDRKVTLHMAAITGITIGSSIATIPAEYRPQNYFRAVVPILNSAAFAIVEISQSVGSVTISFVSDSTKLSNGISAELVYDAPILIGI